MKIDRDIIRKLDKPGPRYTSYPTAPEWSNEIRADFYQQRLRDFGKTSKTLSMYIHIPFCESLCYFCACNVVIRKNEEKYGEEYLGHLFKEIDLVSQAIGAKKIIRQLHWGGGTPSFLNELQMQRLFHRVKNHFEIDFEGEIAIEVDPRRVTFSKVQLLRELGFNRISIGVQDFDDRVQQNIHRIQPFTVVEQFQEWCREFKFQSVNFDLVYGLPFQTVDSFAETVKKTIQLKPDRIALYSFAHVPWLKKHQKKLAKDYLPSNDQKIDIFLKARKLFLQNGYEAIAMDHFALKDDELAKAFQQGQLYRNFMGYTIKPADEYIGLGNSAIGYLEGTYFQNYKTLPEYLRFLKQNQLPIERGKILSEDDLIRQWVINSLMCQFQLDKYEFSNRFHYDFDEYFKEEQKHIGNCQNDALLKCRDHILIVTDLGKIFVRNICMGFDWYLRQKDAHKLFSQTV